MSESCAGRGGGDVGAPRGSRRRRASLALALLPTLAGAACGRTPADPPLVLFLIDTLRADRVGAYGHSRPTTPNIDALAAEGVLFESANAAAPWTLPSVVSLMTSTFPCEHGVVVDGLQPSAALEPLAERLSAAGYATASFYANEYAGPGSGLTRGFATATWVDAADGETVGPFLDAVARRPFFLYVHNAEPHDPYTADRETVRRFAPVGARQRDEANQTLVRYRRLTGADFEAGRPPGATDNSAEQREALATLRGLAPALSGLYDGDVALADQHFGSVRRALEQRGLWDAALVVLLSDHGEEFGEHGGFQHDQSVYEELVRVPLIVRFPGGRHAGRRVGVPVSLVDVVPTIAEVLGRPGLARGSRGRSLLPLARGQEVVPDGGRATAMRDNRKKYFRPFARLRGDLNVVVREDGWKGIWNAERKRLELYDLTSDARERRDVSAEQSERAARLQGVAEEWLQHCRQQGARAPAAPGPSLEAEGRARLRALGYVE